MSSYQVTSRVAPGCFDAHSLVTDQPVRIELAGEEDSALIDVRFSRAAAQLTLCDHPCIAQILETGVLSNGRPWVASARPEGTALSDMFAKGRLTHDQTVALVHSTAGVLMHAHQRAIVHGGVRPHHLTLAKGAKVTISGWAWLRTRDVPAFGDPVSTSVYNPPEHDGTSPITGRADIYALGALAYRAITGVFPDVANDLVDPRTPLGHVISAMLTFDARDRPSARAVVDFLTPLREERRSYRMAAVGT